MASNQLVIILALLGSSAAFIDPKGHYNYEFFDCLSQCFREYSCPRNNPVPQYNRQQFAQFSSPPVANEDVQIQIIESEYNPTNLQPPRTSCHQSNSCNQANSPVQRVHGGFNPTNRRPPKAQIPRKISQSMPQLQPKHHPVVVPRPQKGCSNSAPKENENVDPVKSDPELFNSIFVTNQNYGPPSEDQNVDPSDEEVEYDIDTRGSFS